MPRTCLEQLRRGVCATHQDLIVLTDHPALMALVDFEALFLLFPERGDRFLPPGEGVWLCPDRHPVHVLVGFEDRLMPLGLKGHLFGTPEERLNLYKRKDPEVSALLRSNGALIAIPHSESRTLEEILPLAPEVMEFGNHHAILDPGIRAESLRKNPFTGIASLFPGILTPEDAPYPDLLWLLFYEENEPAYRLWIRTWMLKGTAGIYGCDAHENVYPGILSDGERGDSYRRMLRWATNWVFPEGITEAASPSFLEALKAGRVVTVFEALGTPERFGITYERESRTLIVAYPGEALPFGAVKTRTRIRGFSGEGELLFEITGDKERIEIPQGFAALQLTIEATLSHLKGYLGRWQEKAAGRFYPWISFQPFPDQDYSFPASRK